MTENNQKKVGAPETGTSRRRGRRPLYPDPEERFVNQIMPAVQASAEELMGNENSTVNHEDVEQMVYEKLSNRSIMPTSLYARRATYTTVSDTRRREAHSIPVGDRTNPLFARANPPVEEMVIQREYILATLRQLPPNLRAVVTLRYLEDMSTKDTAEALGIPIGTVKVSLSRGLAALREIMNSEEI